ncbi:MAG: CoA transferase [Acidimicrobiales bacterium]
MPPIEQQPLGGVRVLEVSTGIAAPSCGRYLSALGAEVVKVETPSKLDITRQYVAAWMSRDEPVGVQTDSSPLVDEFLADKRSVGMDIASEAGRAVFRRLIASADIFVINQSAKAVRSLGLTYDEVVKFREDIIYMSLPAFGDSPSMYSEYKTWGPNLASLGGIDHVTGWSDRAPSGISCFAYTDHLAANHTTIVLLAALLERDLTGSGAHVDFSQLESVVSTLGVMITDFTANGRVQQRDGNRVRWAAPHGVYQCRGTDQWVAIVCEDDEDWKKLCEVAASEGFAGDQRWARAERRVVGGAELDTLIEDWTKAHTSRHIAYILQAHGVAAAPVHDDAGLLMDPQLESRDYYITRPSARFGLGMFSRVPPLFSKTPAHHERAGEALGEESEKVLAEWTGMSQGECDELTASGILFPAKDLDRSYHRPYVSWFRYFAPTLGWADPDD